jgi:lipopolysaccharide export system permease protein
MDAASDTRAVSDVKVLNWYIIREVLKGSFLAALILLSLLNFFTFTDELGDLGQGDYDLAAIGEYLILTSPSGVYELMPSAALLGSLVMLGAMASSRELVAMQAAGASKARVIGSVLQAGVILALFSALFSEVIAPETERAAHILKSTSQKKQVTLHTRYGFWLRDGNVYINIRQMKRREELSDISIYELDANQLLKVAMHVEKATYSGDRWQLYNIHVTRFEPGRIVSEIKASEDWSSILSPDLLNVVVVSPEHLSAYDLAKYILYLRENGQKSQVVELAFWSRLMSPLMTLVMLLTALPFVLTVRRTASTGQRIVIGATIGLGFYLFDKMFGHLGLIYEMNPVFAASFPTILFFAGAVFSIRRAG